MIGWSLVVVALATLTGLPHQSHGMKMDVDGGYRDIVIKVAGDRSVPEEMCPKIISNIKKLLDESSHVLYDSLEQRVFFKKVTLVIPSEWRDSMCQTIVRSPQGGTPYQKADISIGGRDVVHGVKPFTKQSRSCGHPGDGMSMPYQFLTSWNRTWSSFGDPAKLFVKEWVKLRYGVFDEHGFADDPLYPNYHHVKGEVFPTGTANDLVNGEWIDGTERFNCNPAEEKNCYFKPAGDNSHLTCSIGYLHYLPSVHSYCKPEDIQGQPMSPTKQNILCEGRSTAQVVASHDDFIGRANPVRRDDLKLDPDIEIVREPEPQYVLVMEKSVRLDAYGQWKWINKAAQKLIRYDLPSISKVSIVTFTNDSKVEHSLAELDSDDARARLADTIPDKYHLSMAGTENDASGPCLLCGVQKAIHDVLRNNMAGAHLILVTRGSQDTLKISDEQAIEEYVKFYHMKVSSVLIPDQDKLPLAFYDSIARLSGGSSHIIKHPRTHTSIEVYMDLLEAFSGIIAPVFDVHGLPAPPVTIHQQMLEVSGYSSSTGTFKVDPTLGNDTRFGIYVDDEEDHLVRSVTFTDKAGNLYGPYTSMSSLYDIINLKTVNFPVEDAPPFDHADLLGTEWQYFIEWYPGRGSSGGSGAYQRTSAVRLTSGPRPGHEDVKVEVWTDSDSSSDLVTGLHPVTVYARVTKGGRPVHDANAQLVILVAGQDGSEEGSLRMDLLDNGNGDPDLTQGDGVYSRYVTRYLTPGRYRFRVEVNDAEGAAFTANPFSMANMASAILSNDLQGGLDSKALPDQLMAPCCGSVVRVEERDREPTEAFTRVGWGPVIHLFSVPDPGTDLMPPGRITDLKVLMLESGQLVATWTAPGDDYDAGSVSGYRFVVADNVSHLLDSESDKQTLVGFTQPDEAGAQTSYQFEVRADDDKYNKDIFVGLVAFDERDNEGKVSNIVTLHLTRDGVYGSDREGAFPLLESQGGASSTSWNIRDEDSSVVIGAVCGVIAVLAALLWVGIWYFRANGGKGARRSGVSTKKSGVTANLVGETGSSQHNDSTQDIEQPQPTHPSQQHHTVTVTDAFNAGKFNTLVRNPRNATLIHPVMTDNQYNQQHQRPPTEQNQHQQTPIYWSASQLLSEHERNTSGGQGSSQGTRQFNTLPSGGHVLDPISEEYTSDDLFTEGLEADAYAQGLANYGYQTQSLYRQQQRSASASNAVATSTPLRTKTNNNDIYGPNANAAAASGSTLVMSESLLGNTSKLHEPIYVGYGDGSNSAKPSNSNGAPVYEPRKKSKSAKISTTSAAVTSTLHGANTLEEDIYAKRSITHV